MSLREVREELRRASKDASWVLALGVQGGLMLALPVIGGLAFGYWLDRLIGLGLPWLTLIMTLIGAIMGPILLYRWVMSSVTRRVERRLEYREQNEENLQDGELHDNP